MTFLNLLQYFQLILNFGVLRVLFLARILGLHPGAKSNTNVCGKTTQKHGSLQKQELNMGNLGDDDLVTSTVPD